MATFLGAGHAARLRQAAGCAMLWMVGILGSTAGLPSAAHAQVANFHPCNADPSLPICLHGYGRRIAVKRWGALPEPLDPDAVAGVSLKTHDRVEEIKRLKASAIYVEDMGTEQALFARDENTARPIASIVKLMTALVVVDSNQPMDEPIRIEAADRNLGSDLPARLSAGTRLSRSDLLHLMLTSSDNTAAHALGRSYAGGMPAFVAAMNAKASELGMQASHFTEPVGLSSENVASARDLAKLVRAAAHQPLIRAYTTDTSYQTAGQTFRNTNMLVGRPRWDIVASKTGTTREAGDCLVMMVRLDGRDVAIVLLNSQGQSGSRFGDAVRLRRILDSTLAAK